MIFRTYPALRYLIFLAGGILSSDKLDLFWTLTGTGICLLCGILALKIRSLRHVIPLSFFFLGGAVPQLYQGSVPLLHKAEGVMVEIASYTETKPASYKVTAKVLGTHQNGQWQPSVGKSPVQKAAFPAIGSSSGKALLYFDQKAGIPPQYGEIYVLNGPLREIEDPKSPYEFNYRQYQARNRIFHQQFLRQEDFRKVGIAENKSLLYYAHQANVYTHRVFSEVLTGQSQLGVAEAMIGGMRSELDMETLQWYTDTGTVHALAVSGMHIAILFWVLNAVFGFFLNRRKLPFIACVLFFLWSYAIFTGLSPSVCRSTLMFTIFQVGVFLKRSGNPVNTLLFSALILLMIVPEWIYDVGFQLSYLAVLGILVLYPWLLRRLHFRQRALQWLWEATAVSIAAQVYTLPLTLYYFHQFPNYMLVANPVVGLISIPLLPAGLLLLFLFKVPVIGFLLGWIFKGLIVAMNACVYYVHTLPAAVTYGLALSVTGVILMYAVIGFFQAYLKFRRVVYLKGMAVLIFFLMIWGAGKKVLQFRQAELTFHHIPKGYGLSLVKGRSAVFISSDSLTREPLVGKYHLRNYYDALGISSRNVETTTDGENELIRSELGDIFWVKARNTRFLVRARYTLVSHNALDPDTEIQGTQLILDDTNRKSYVEKVRAANAGVIVLNEVGSKTFRKSG